jgi:hypothetical protein
MPCPVGACDKKNVAIARAASRSSPAKKGYLERKGHVKGIGLGWVLWALALPALGEGLPTAPPIQAVRTAKPIELDGKVDEPQWQAAPVFTDFVTSYPDPGARPSQKTELRVLYDDDNLYVSMICFDTEPGRIVAPLDRRDNMPPSDNVAIAIDSAHDRRTANYFQVNAAGVLRDQLWYDDTQSTSSWNAVWDARAARRPDGWSAEFVIPLNVLRFPAKKVQLWGFAAERNNARAHEQIDTALLPHSANAVVSRFGELTGILDLKPRSDLEITPYVAARGTVRPRFDAASLPQPRIFDPALDFGGDLQTSITSGLTLNAALNPDFGEVEPDALILNLGNTEIFFNEKRQFFTQGLELFQPLANGGNGGSSGVQPFYSRRIGLTAPILGAAKLVGSLNDGLKLGVLEAVVLGPQDDAKAKYAYQGLDTDQAPLDRTVQWHSEAPFHLGPNDELPAERTPSMNYFAAVGRQKLWSNSALGATFASATPLGQLCYPGDFLDPSSYDKDSCAARGANTLSLESSIATASGDWGVRTQFNGSQVVGGPSSFRRRDGVVMKPGDLGYGAFVKAGKFGGEPFQFNAWYLYDSPRLDVNPTGYQPDDNLHELGMYAAYTRPNGFGSLHDFELSTFGYADFSADGRHIPRGGRFQGDISWTLSNFFSFGFELGWEDPHFDIREINDTGIAFQRRSDVYLAWFSNTDTNKKFWFSFGGDVFKSSSTGPMPAETGYGLNGSLNYRPVPALNTQVSANYNHNPQGPRFVDDLGGGNYVLGAQHPAVLSVTLRASWIFDPRLSLQAYAQFFTAYGQYGPFFSAFAPNGEEIRLTQMVPTTYTASNPDFHESALNVNLVARWEYRLGSTIFLVYSRSQDELPFATGRDVTTLAPNALGQGRTSETFLVKWSYWWDV